MAVVTGPLFVDTGAWYALQVPDDDWHEDAASTMRAIVERGLALATSNLVVGETYTLLVRTHGNEAGWRFVETVRQSPRLEIVTLDAGAEREAWAILRKFSDQDFSFVDGTSFAIMRKRRFKAAFAFDRHFASAGFLRVPADQKI
jgi:predicted nucleic acid-binding protein